MAKGKVIPNTSLILSGKLRTGEALPPSHIVLGTGSATPTRDSVGVQTEILRKAATITRVGSQVTYRITVAKGELTANITEFSLTNAASGVGDCDYLEVCDPVVCDDDHGAVFEVIRDRTSVTEVS